jgi:hypothetical protein
MSAKYGVILDSFASEILLRWKADRKSKGFSAGSARNVSTVAERICTMSLPDIAVKSPTARRL